MTGIDRCVDVALQHPLRERAPIDGGSGTSARRIDRDAEEASEDWFALRALELGCPLWVP